MGVEGEERKFQWYKLYSVCCVSNGNFKYKEFGIKYFNLFCFVLRGELLILNLIKKG